MSHHLDSPIARQDLRLDFTDLYVFRGETGTAFVINVCHSIGKPPIPGYHPEGMYEFKVDLNGDAIEEITYRLTFEERDAQGKQKYTVRRISGKDAVDPHAAGTVVAQGVTDETVTTPSGLRAWAGHAGDPFWIEPDVLHAVGHAFEDGTKGISPAGTRAKRTTCLPVIPYMPWCWKCPMPNCSPVPATTGRSAYGQCLHSKRMREDGARSTASDCQ